MQTPMILTQIFRGQTLPKRTKSQEIGEAGEAFVSSALGPPTFAASTFKPDYGLDLLVTVFSNGETTGVHFFVQVKAHAAMKPTSKGLLGAFDRERYRYLVEQHRSVNVIVFVDLAARAGYFHLVNRRTMTELAGESKQIQLPLSSANVISDQARLLEEVNRDFARIRPQGMGAVRQTIEETVAAMNTIDERLKHEIIVTANGPTIQTYAVSAPVTLQLTVSSRSGRVKEVVDGVLHLGHTLVQSDDVSFKVAGSPLFDKMQPTSLSFSSPIRLDVTISVRGVNGARFVLPSCEVDSERIAVAIEYGWAKPNCPFALRFAMSKPNVVERSIDITCNYKWSMAVWEGKPLQSLAWTKPLSEFLCACKTGEVFLEIGHEGVILFEQPLEGMAHTFAELEDYVTAIDRAVHIARRHGLDATHPVGLTEGAFVDAKAVCDLIENHKADIHHPMTFDLPMRLNPDLPPELVGKAGKYRLLMSSFPISFFDRRLLFNDATLEVDLQKSLDMTVVNDLDRVFHFRQVTGEVELNAGLSITDNGAVEAEAE